MRRAAALIFAVFAATAPGLAADQGNHMNDPYIWLEAVHGEKPLAWVKEQNAKSLGLLKASPDYQKNYDFILSVLDAKDRIPYGGLDHGFVYNYWQDQAHPKGLWRRTSIADYAKAEPQWEVLIDLDKLAADEKENWVWKGTACSSSQKRCLVNLSRGGGDAVVVREFDMGTKSFVKDGFTLKESKSDVTLVDDDTVLFGTDFGAGSMTSSGYPRIVKMWHRGEAIDAAKTQLEGKDGDVSVSATVLRNGADTLPMIVRGTSFFEAEYYLAAANQTWWKIPVPLSAQLQGYFKGQLLFSLREDWTPPGGAKLGKGTLISFAVDGLQPDHLTPISVLYAPGPRASIETVATGHDAVYVAVLNNVIGEVHAFRLANGTWADKKLPLPAGGSANIVSTNDYGPEVYLSFQSFLKAPTLYFDGGKDAPKEIKALPARFDASGMETVQYEATSTDGTKIPYFVMRPKNLSGPAPTILNGYGGFEISETPFYSANFGKLWVAKGGVYVLANIRGGGEFGPAWHEAALKENRQKAFDDFAAVAADLIARKITTPKQLGIVGGSNGGLLVSTVMTQHPELLGAVVCQVPLIDMIRYTQIGAGASWIAEYGDPADPKQAEYIAKYSPYQNVSKDKKYAPVFFVTATSDDRVTPVHARKMAARMMEQGHEVLFYENTDGGHAAAADHKQSAELWGLTFVYFAEKLGLK
jgi:Serine proteases of the peptidase family S9A